MKSSFVIYQLFFLSTWHASDKGNFTLSKYEKSRFIHVKLRYTITAVFWKPFSISMIFLFGKLTGKNLNHNFVFFFQLNRRESTAYVGKIKSLGVTNLRPLCLEKAYLKVSYAFTDCATRSQRICRRSNIAFKFTVYSTISPGRHSTVVDTQRRSKRKDNVSECKQN